MNVSANEKLHHPGVPSFQEFPYTLYGFEALPADDGPITVEVIPAWTAGDKAPSANLTTAS